MIRAAFCVIFGIAVAAAEATFTIPSSFEGNWVGIPSFSALGPFDNNYTFTITAVSNGDYLLENNIIYDGYLMGWQRFYVEGTSPSPGELWYCGYLRNFSNGAEEAGSFYPDVFTVQSQSDTHVTWCLDTTNPAVSSRGGSPFPTGCELCGCANWTLSLASSGELMSSMFMAGADGHTHSRHLSVALTYAGPAAPVDESDDWPAHGANFTCDFDGRDGRPVEDDAGPGRAGSDACPFLRNRRNPLPGGDRSGSADLLPTGHSPKRLITATTSSSSSSSAAADKFDHCYTLNGPAGFDLAWTLRPGASEAIVGNGAWLDVRASAPVPDASHWVAVGFRPLSRKTDGDGPASLDALGTGRGMNFGMEGADIVAGFGPSDVGGGGSGNVTVLYAALLTGPPQIPDPPESALEIFNASVYFEPFGGETNGGVLTLLFTRAAAGTGHLAALGLPRRETSLLTPFADMLWAVGPTEIAATVPTGSSGGGVGTITNATCSYHENTRGLRVIDWKDPSKSMTDLWEC